MLVPEQEHQQRGADTEDDQQDQDHGHGDQDDESRRTCARTVNLPDTENVQDDGPYGPDYRPYDRYPGYELRHLSVRGDPKGRFEPRVARPYKKQHEQVEYASHYNQNYRCVCI